MAVSYNDGMGQNPVLVNYRNDEGQPRQQPTQQMQRQPDGKQAPMVFPTFGDIQTGNPTYSGAPQQQQGTPAPQGGAAPQQAPTFRTLQMAGMARPAPPPPQPMQPGGLDQNAIAADPQGFAQWQQRAAAAGYNYPMPGQQAQGQGNPAGMGQPSGPMTPQFQYGASGLGGQVQQLLSQMLQNPTAYNDEVIEAQRKAGMGRLDQQSAMQKARLDEEMAGRGLFSSTVAQGRLGDIDINRTNAIADMESRFLGDRARAMDEGRRAAAGLGMEYDRAAFDQQLGAYRANLDRDDLSWRREDSAANRAQRASEFDRNYGLDRDKFGEDTRQFDVEQGRRGREFDLNYGLDRDKFGEDRRQFDVSQGYKDRLFGEDTRRFDLGYGLDRDRYGLDKDRESWRQNMDYYDRYSTSDLLDPSAGYPGQGQPAARPSRRDFDSIFDYNRALGAWNRQYGGR